jgi:hypothetical protein
MVTRRLRVVARGCLETLDRGVLVCNPAGR